MRTIKLPADLGRSITTFVWSPTARRILICAADEIHVYSALDGDFHAAIRNPSATIGKLTFVDFGATDGEVCVCSAHGIRLSLFNLASSKVVEISNPKFYTASSAARGFSFRPHTRHLALLTRTSGKDTVSIHGPDSRHVQRSWNPDTVDAQGLAWTPDGKWLVMWESASQGHRVAFLTPDGHKYRDWPGSPPPAFDDLHDRLGAGVKLVVSSPNSQSIAVGDYSRCISVVQLASLTNQLQLRHSTTVEPKDTLQVCPQSVAAASKPPEESGLTDPRYGKSRSSKIKAAALLARLSELTSRCHPPQRLRQTPRSSKQVLFLYFSTAHQLCWQ